MRSELMVHFHTESSRPSRKRRKERRVEDPSKRRKIARDLYLEDDGVAAARAAINDCCFRMDILTFEDVANARRYLVGKSATDRRQYLLDCLQNHNGVAHRLGRECCRMCWCHLAAMPIATFHRIKKDWKNGQVIAPPRPAFPRKAHKVNFLAEVEIS